MAQTHEGAIKIAAKKAGISISEYVARISSGKKKCTICKEWLDIDNFDADKSRCDRKAARCKICAKAIWRRKAMTSNKRSERRDGDKKQARIRINHDIKAGIRPNPNDLYCSLCGHKGLDKRHEYHHTQGYSAMHHYDVLPLCSSCHHKKHPNLKGELNNE